MAVRNTDVSVYFKYVFHLRGLGRKILYAAQKVIFATPAYCNFLAHKYLPSVMKSGILSAQVIPNGLKPEWFDKVIARDENIILLKN